MTHLVAGIFIGAVGMRWWERANSVRRRLLILSCDAKLEQKEAVQLAFVRKHCNDVQYIIPFASDAGDMKGSASFDVGIAQDEARESADHALMAYKNSDEEYNNYIDPDFVFGFRNYTHEVAHDKYVLHSVICVRYKGGGQHTEYVYLHPEPAPISTSEDDYNAFVSTSTHEAINTWLKKNQVLRNYTPIASFFASLGAE